MSQRHTSLLAALAAMLLLQGTLAVSAAQPDGGPQLAWTAAMRRVHGQFAGQAGTFAQLGDSITVSLAFWTPLLYEPRGLSEALSGDLRLVRDYQRQECWRDWKGPEFGSEGGTTVRWAHDNIDRWLDKLNPEVAVIMFGTNDLTQLQGDEYAAMTRSLVERCLANGTIAVLTTIPPRHGLVERSTEFAEVVRKLARELNVPLIDYHAEILKRRPGDWDGALEPFKDMPGDAYNVPTLIARDGVHPSNPLEFQDYSERSLSTNGFALRNALTLRAYAELIRTVLKPSRPGQ